MYKAERGEMILYFQGTHGFSLVETQGVCMGEALWANAPI